MPPSARTSRCIHLRDAEADLAAFADMDAAGGICLVTHGTLLDAERVCLLTGEAATLASVRAWYWDLYGAEPGLALLSVDGEKRLGVLPAFFAHYCEDFPNSLVVLAACSSLRGETLAGALGAAGVGTLVGFDDTVGLDYARGPLDFWGACSPGRHRRGGRRRQPGRGPRPRQRAVHAARQCGPLIRARSRLMNVEPKPKGTMVTQEVQVGIVGQETPALHLRDGRALQPAARAEARPRVGA